VLRQGAARRAPARAKAGEEIGGIGRVEFGMKIPAEKIVQAQLSALGLLTEVGCV
jgi:hypothetical protein